MQHAVELLVKEKMGQLHSALWPDKTMPSREISFYQQQVVELEGKMHQDQETIHTLQLTLESRLEEMRQAYLASEDLRKEYHRLKEEWTHLLEENQRKLHHKGSLIADYQMTIAEQRGVIEKKTIYIRQLEKKMEALVSEIKYLLQPDPPISMQSELDLPTDYLFERYKPAIPFFSTAYDYSLRVKKYIERAENLTGMDHLGYIGRETPRFLDINVDSYAVDRRRLFDSFKDETNGVVFLLSLHEQKFVFIHSLIKSLVGWSPEKMIHDFPQLITRGYAEWEASLQRVKMMNESAVQLHLLNKAGQCVQIEGYMGKIARGPFARHALGLFVLSTEA
jgi:hypothetical protein